MATLKLKAYSYCFGSKAQG